MTSFSPLPDEIFPGIADRGRKTFLDGSHRVRSPEETLVGLQQFHETIGISRVANVTGLDTIGIPVVMVTRPNSRSLVVSQGKGNSLAAAKVSGLMESIELYHAERVSGPLLLNSYNELRQDHRVVDVDQLLAHDLGRFRRGLPILWMQAYDISQREWIYVPFEAVHRDDTDRAQALGGCFFNSTNGLASGNHLLEAISHGICELLERDAHWRWVAAGREYSDDDRIDPASITDERCRDLLARCAQAKMLVGLWDITADVDVSATYCVLAGPTDDASRRLYVCSGSGCHAVREIAVQRALTEAVQSRLTMIAGSREDMPLATYERARNPKGLERYMAMLDKRVYGKRLQDLPSELFEHFADEVRWLVRQLRQHGFHNVLVVNLTKTRIGIPVVRVIIPGTQIVRE